MTAQPMHQAVSDTDALTFDLRGIDDVMESWGWLSIPVTCQCGDADCDESPRAWEIVPKWDLRDHYCGNGAPPCWCEPEANFDQHVIVHHAMDGRTAFEAGERKVS